MNSVEAGASKACSAAIAELLGSAWRDEEALLESALLLWSTRGVDPATGVFHERLGLDGIAPVEPRRVRVQVRQIYCYALAARMGWGVNTRGTMRTGIAYLLAHCLGDKGFLLHTAKPGGGTIDAGPDLYDQAFLLLALSEVFRATGEAVHVKRAKTLLAALQSDFANPAGGFRDRPGRETPLRANPHMHLLEAALAWIEADGSECWKALASDMGRLCTARFTDSSTGALLEYFAADWTPLRSGDHAIVEPGHLFEWCWLLLRLENALQPGVAPMAKRFYEIAAQHGICATRHVAINSLNPDLTWRDSGARLWPQTEWLKASLGMAEMDPGGADIHLAQALAAHQTLLRYRDGLHPGLWRDKLLPDGQFVDEPAPASTFYHLACAAAELRRAAEIWS